MKPDDDSTHAILADHLPTDPEKREQALHQLQEFFGTPVTVVGNDEAEKAVMVVCISGAKFMHSDNVFTVCADCRGCIQHRPNAPKKPDKVCLGCAQKRMEAAK